jgi:hypothetical protein
MKKPFDRIITVMFENQYRNYVIQDPFLKKLASAGADMTNYFGVFHPSQTNYLASLAGEICSVTNDNPPISPLLQNTLVDLLEDENVSWKAYMEAYPNEPWNPDWIKPDYPEAEQPINEYPPAGGDDLSRYFRKHNAFASFHNIQKDEDRWSKIVDDFDFWNDVKNNNLPEYSWFTPDIWNDGHYLYNTHIDTNPRTELVPQLSAWLENVFLGDIDASKLQGASSSGLDKIGLNLDVDLLLTDPQKAWQQSNIPSGTLIVVTFDEADFNAVGYDTNYDGPNQIYTVLLGDMIAPGTVISTPYNHYNLIRTVEENFSLGSLMKNDFGANYFRFLWNEKFAWNSPTDSSIIAGDTLALANGEEGLHMVFSDKEGNLFESIMVNSSWSSVNALNIATLGTIAMTAIDNKSILIIEGDNGVLLMSSFDSQQLQWSPFLSIGQFTSGSFALTTFLDMYDSTMKMMLCWTSEDGFIQSMIGERSGFSGEVKQVNQLTDGAMSLAQLGASLFLVYKERNTRKMRMASYNVGSFNAFKALNFQGGKDPINDTTLHKWSVQDFLVGNFSKKMGALANEYQNLGKMTLGTFEGEMHLVHRGGYADLSTAYTEIFGLTGIYSAADQKTNGFGTLNQAGWTKETELPDVIISPNSPVALCSFDDQIMLAWVDSNSKTIKYKIGEYV